MKAASSHQYGFTLIEIVMVLVLLGILASVAVPKYFDYQDLAEQRAALATVAEAQARLDARFGEKLLEGNSCADAVAFVRNLDNLADKEGKVFGEYTLAYGAKNYIIARKNGSEIDTKTPLVFPVCEDFSLLNDTFTDMHIKEAIKYAIFGGFKGTGTRGMTWQYNSGYINTNSSGNNTQIGSTKDYFAEHGLPSLESMGATSWAFNPFKNSSGGYLQENGYYQGLFFWTDKDITGLSRGTRIPVLVYDTRSNKYSVAKADIVKDTGSNANILWLGSNVTNPNGITAQSNLDISGRLVNSTATGLSAADAQALYNAIKLNP